MPNQPHHPPPSGTRSQVHLLQGRPLFFPFVSGSFAYECSTCDAPCCKGQPVGIGRSRELVTIQQAQPRAALFATLGFRGGPLLSLSPPPEKCWFLDRKQRCRLEHVLGRDAKPTGCRLFPFSTIAALGETLAIIPDFLCPITLQESSSPSQLSSHDALTWEFKETQVPRSGHAAMPAPPDLPWAEGLALERHVVTAAAATLALAVAPRWYRDYADVQHQLTCAVSGAEYKPSAMAKMEQDIRRFLAVNESLSPQGVRELIALTGVLRLTLIEEQMLARRSLPATLLALSVVGAAFEHMRGSKRTLRSLLSMWTQQGPVLYALAHLGSRPLPRSKTSLDKTMGQLGATRPALQAVVEKIRVNGQRSVSSTVEELLRGQKDAFAPPLTADGMAMLHGLGRVLLQACTFTPL